MIKKIEQLIIKLTVLFTLQAFLFVSTAFARIENSADCLCLSPTLNISIPNFNQAFNNYFSEQSIILRQPDTIKARTDFNNTLYALPFKSLFPRVIQYKLLNTIKQNLLTDLSNQDIADIQVEYVSNDSVYVLFQKQGEKNLNLLIGNEELKKQLLPIKQTRNKEWIALEGYNPPSKKRAKPETIEKYKRKWLLDSISAVTGYTKKELKSKPTGALWLIYFQYKLSYEFGQRLLDAVKDNQGVEFKVNVRLKDGNELEAYVSISGENFKTTIKQTKGRVKTVQAADALLEGLKPLTFEQRIKKLENVTEEFKGEMHTLQSQKQDLVKVVQAIDLLKRIKNIDLAGVSSDTRDEIKQELVTLDKWLAKSPEYRRFPGSPEEDKGRLQEKHQAHLLIEGIVKKKGKLAYDDFSAVIENIEKAIDYLEARTVFLFSKINERNILLREYAIQQNDHYFYSEFIKNELSIVRAAIKINSLNIALSSIEYLESEILKNPVVENKKALYVPAIQAIKLLRHKLDKADDAKSASTALRLINQLEYDKQQSVAAIIEKLISARKWLGNKNLTEYAKQLSFVINKLNTVSKPNVSFYQVIAYAVNQTEELTEKVNSSKSVKMNPKFKSLIVNQFAFPKKKLKILLAKISERNSVIKKALPGYKLVNLEQTVVDLEKDFQQKSGYASYEHLRSDLIDKLDYAVKALSETQNGFYRGKEFVRIEELMPVIINQLQSARMVGQAI